MPALRSQHILYFDRPQVRLTLTPVKTDQLFNEYIQRQRVAKIPHFLQRLEVHIVGRVEGLRYTKGAVCHRFACALLSSCRHPDAQRRLGEEVRAKLPSTINTDHTPRTAGVLDTLPYLHAVCNEVLRLHPQQASRRGSPRETRRFSVNTFPPELTS